MELNRIRPPRSVQKEDGRIPRKEIKFLQNRGKLLSDIGLSREKMQLLNKKYVSNHSEHQNNF